VTDDDGATDTVSHDVTVTAPPPNIPPTAAFTSSATFLQASFDATASNDPDGTIGSYSWDFGDNTAAGSGVTPSHTYAAAGTYTVTLTVKDDDQDTGTVSHDITVQAQPVVVQLAADAFGRTTTNSWGTADQGGAWTLNGNATNFSVGGGLGSIKMPSAGSGPSVFLGGISSDDTDVQVSVSLDVAPVGGTAGVDQGILLRRIAAVGDYRAKVRFVPGGAVRLGLYRTDSAGAQTAVVAEQTVTGLTYAAGDVLNIRAEAFGTSPTTLRAKLWRQGTTEPTAWMVSGTDSTAALQTTGAVGFHSFLAGTVTNAPVVARFDDLKVFKATTLP
jgi:PKD repeat protein